jgi:hypothetical protein
MSGQLQAPATLPPWKEPTVPTGWEVEWAPEPVWTTWRTEFLPLLGIELALLGRPARSQTLHDCTPPATMMMMIIIIIIIPCLTNYELCHNSVWRRGYIDPCLLDLGTSRVVSVTHLPFHPREKRVPGMYWIGGWVGPREGNGMDKWKFLTLPGLELRAFGSPARNQSPYRLSYRASSTVSCYNNRHSSVRRCSAIYGKRRGWRHENVQHLRESRDNERAVLISVSGWVNHMA